MKTAMPFKFVLTAMLISCAFMATAQVKELSVSIHPSKTYQTINNFGGSDAWAAQFVGNWPDEKRNAIADLLFSNENQADGSPKGIGLSMWRFNIGAGSAEQGRESGIRDEWRRAESFLNNDGTYNWQKQASQIWFLKAAKQRGVNAFLGFTNSPPVQFTITGKAYANKGQANIAPNKYADFATFLAKVVKGIEQSTQIKLNYISPVNEPQWDWSDGGQEGAPYNNTQIAGLVRSIDSVFVHDKIASKIIIGEAGKIDYLFTKGDKPGKGFQINDLFKPGSSNYIGNLRSVAPTITAHSYFTTSPMASSIKMRKALADSVAQIKGLDYWQSEYCILGDNASEINGSKRDLGMDAALYMASVIHTDLAVANASAWQWWTSISAYDYKDGLVYVDKNTTDGNFYTSKMLWVLGNYSRFIKPGFVRVEASLANIDLPKPLLLSAYKKNKNLVLVIVNPNIEAISLNLDEAGLKKGTASAYITSQNSDLKFSKVNGAKANIPARSVVTITAQL